MRKKLLFLFICFVTIPIVIIYTVATSIFNRRTEMNLKDIYSNDIRNMAQIAENYFSESLTLTMYPLMEPNLYKFFSADSEESTFAESCSNAQTILTSSPYVFGGLRGVIMQRNDGVQITTSSNVTYKNKIPLHSIEQATLKNGDCYWEFQKENSFSLISITRMIKSKYNFSISLGYVQASISISELCNTIKNAIIGNDFAYFILDENNQILLSTKQQNDSHSLLSEYNYAALCTLSDQAVCTVLEGDHFISAQKIKDTPYVICNVIKSGIFSATRGTLLNILSSVACLTFVFFILLAFVFSSTIVKPLKELGDKMNSLSDENFSVKIPVNQKRSDEITSLTIHFNQMVERLEYLYKQVYMSEIELKQSQIIALQSQINPHFLYNTMDTIYWMSEMGNTKDVSNIVSNMSRLLRLTFSPNSKETHLLKEELEHLYCYIEIQKIRYGDSVTFELQYDHTLDHLPVLRLLLQPLVENALIHGLKEQASECIIIQVFLEESFLIYRVKNNGTPLDINLIEGILQSKNTIKKGFAIQNIDKRLRLKYGDESGLKCWIEEPFNIFEIKQPILKDKELSNDNFTNC